MDTSARLKKLRKSLGYNQLEFAKILQTSQQVISAIERGKYGISKDVEHSLRLQFPDVDIDYICGLRDHPAGAPGQLTTTAHDPVILITRHNQSSISRKINDADWMYQQPRIISSLPTNAQYLAVEVPNDTMVDQSPLSINPGDIVIGALINTITPINRVCFAIAEGIQIAFGLLTGKDETSIELTPTNGIYKPIRIDNDSLIRLYRIIELHTSRHAL